MIDTQQQIQEERLMKETEGSLMMNYNYFTIFERH